MAVPFTCRVKLGPSTPLSIPIYSTTSVNSLKKHIERDWGIDAGHQKLSLLGEELRGSELLHQKLSREGTILEVEIVQDPHKSKHVPSALPSTHGGQPSAVPSFTCPRPKDTVLTVVSESEPPPPSNDSKSYTLLEKLGQGGFGTAYKAKLASFKGQYGNAPGECFCVVAFFFFGCCSFFVR
jgi:hypothetical protein